LQDLKQKLSQEFSLLCFEDLALVSADPYFLRSILSTNWQKSYTPHQRFAFFSGQSPDLALLSWIKSICEQCDVSASFMERAQLILNEILRLQRHFGVTAIIVSHDVGEVYKLANRVLMMEAGRFVRHGSPAEVFSHGHTSGKFRFIGELLQKEGVDVMVALTVLIGNQLVRVMVMPEEAAAINPGDKIVLVSKAFNPMVLRLSRNTSQVTDLK
jgi:hypothetical protein